MTIAPSLDAVGFVASPRDDRQLLGSEALPASYDGYGEGCWPATLKDEALNASASTAGPILFLT